MNTEDMWFLPLSDEKNDDLGIRVCLKNHDLIKDNEILRTLLYKMVDTILGEKSFALNIKYVDTDLRPDDPAEEVCIRFWNYQNILSDIYPGKGKAGGNVAKSAVDAHFIIYRSIIISCSGIRNSHELLSLTSSKNYKPL